MAVSVCLITDQCCHIVNTHAKGIIAYKRFNAGFCNSLIDSFLIIFAEINIILA